MKRLPRLLVSAAFAIAPTAAIQAAPAETKVLTTLDRFEPFDGHVFHAGNLWVARSRQNLGSYYRLEVYDGNGVKLAEAELTHSLRYIYPYGNDAVIIVGIGTDQVSHYTIARLVNGRVQLSHAAIPYTALADRFAGRPGALVFSDPGGYDDPADPSTSQEPLHTLFTLSRSGQPRYLKPKIAGPRDGLMIGNSLYLISSPDIFTGGVTLNKVNLAAETFTKILDHRHGLSEMSFFPALNLLAIAESDAKQAVLIDLKGDRLSETLPIDAYGRPRAVTSLNNCLLVGVEDNKQVLVYDLTASHHEKPIAQWDLASLGEKLFKLRNLAADPATGHVFVRSAYPCSPADNSCGAYGRNSVVMITPAADDPVMSACVNKH